MNADDARQAALGLLVRLSDISSQEEKLAILKPYVMAFDLVHVELVRMEQDLALEIDGRLYHSKTGEEKIVPPNVATESWRTVVPRMVKTYLTAILLITSAYLVVGKMKDLSEYLTAANELNLERQRAVMHLDIERCRKRDGFPVISYWSSRLERCDPLPRRGSQ